MVEGKFQPISYPGLKWCTKFQRQQQPRRHLHYNGWIQEVVPGARVIHSQKRLVPFTPLPPQAIFICMFMNLEEDLAQIL